MSFRRRIKYFLVHTLNLPNKQADQLIKQGVVEIDSTQIFDNCFLNDESEVRILREIKRAAKKFEYFKFYKPVGYQSSLNAAVSNNLLSFFPSAKSLAIAGRLDQASEGLLILSNDGKWIEEVCNPKYSKEKEYEVHLDKEPTEDFLKNFRTGVRVGNEKSRPCECVLISPDAIRVTLTEGKNRQIRRMCFNLGYRVIKLKRLRIGPIKLDELKSGEVQQLSAEEIKTQN